MSSPLFETHYDLVPADHAVKLDRLAGASPAARSFSRFAYAAIVGLAWTSAVLFYLKQGDRNHTYLVSGGFATLLTLFLPRLYAWYQQSFWESILRGDALRGLVGPVTLTLTEDGIDEVGPMTTTRGRWQDVARVERVSACTLVFLAPMIVVLVPDRAFPDPAARASFERLIESRVAASRP